MFCVICFSRGFFAIALLQAVMLGFAAGLVAAENDVNQRLNFVDHVRPVFRSHCVSCHNPNKSKGDLDLTSYSALMRGGSSGDVIEPGVATDSYLLQLVTHTDSPEMPPNSDRIPESDIETLRKWIDDGAIATSNATQLVKRKRRSFEMSNFVNKRPESVAMPQGLSTQVVANTVRDPLPLSLASSPWSPLVAVASANQVLLYHAKRSHLLGVLPWGDGKPEIVRFSHDGSLLLAAGGKGAVSGNVVFWDVVSGQQKLKIGDELDSVLAADLSSDGSQVVTGGPERLVRLYSINSQSEPTVFREHTDWVTAVEFSPDAKYLVTTDRSGGVILRVGKTGESLFRLPSHKDAVTSVSWRADSKLFATSSESGRISIWNARNAKLVRSFTAHGGGCLSVTFTRDGKLVSGGRDKLVALWNLKGKSIRKFKGSSEIVLAVCVNDETNQIFAGTFAGRVKKWNLKDSKSRGDLLPSLTAADHD